MAVVVAAPARARVFDELEVHGTDLAAPGEAEAILRSAYGLRGRRAAARPGELAPDGGLYLSPAIAYGPTAWWETAIFAPAALDRRGALHPGGARLHNVLALPRAAASPWSYGLVLELRALTRRFQPAPFGAELRPVAGYAAGPWTAILNLGIEASLGRRGETAFTPSLRAEYRLGEAASLGIEHFAELGPLLRPVPLREQAHQLFGVAGLRLGSAELHFGIGRGLTRASDPWVAKLHLTFGL